MNFVRIREIADRVYRDRVHRIDTLHLIDAVRVIAEASILLPREILTVATRRARPDLAPGFVALMTWIAVWRMGGRGMPGPIDAIAGIAPRPVLLMQGSADDAVPPNDVQVLFAQAREPKSIWIGKGAGHCQLREKYPEEYRQHVIDFLTRYFPVGNRLGGRSFRSSFSWESI